MSGQHVSDIYHFLLTLLTETQYFFCLSKQSSPGFSCFVWVVVVYSG